MTDEMMNLRTLVEKSSVGEPVGAAADGADPQEDALDVRSEDGVAAELRCQCMKCRADRSTTERKV